MKYKYCPRCRKAYIRSYLEKENCMYCNGVCEVVDVKRNATYYFGYAMLVIGAAAVLVPRFIAVSDRAYFLYFGIALAIAGSVMVIVGSSKMAGAAAESCERELTEK